MTVFGYDVSHYQAGFDHAKARAEGMDFVAIKCTEGRGMIDEEWPWHRDAALAAGLHVAAYHFLRSDSPVAEQAQNMADWIGDKTIPVAIDCEAGSAGSKPTLSHVLSFQAALKSLGITATILYLPRWYWEGALGSPSLFDVRLALWQSSYGANTFGSPSTTYPGDGASQWLAFDGVAPALLQYGSRVTIGGQSIDGNAYRGKVSDLAQWFKPPLGGEVPLSPEDLVKIGQAVRPVVDVRVTALQARVNELALREAARDQQLLEVLAALQTLIGLLPEQVAAKVPTPPVVNVKRDIREVLGSLDNEPEATV